MKKIKWIVLPYIVMGICIAIGLVIGMAPELLGDVIPRHGVIGRMLTAANHRKIQDSQHTEMVVPDYVRRVVTLGTGTVDLVGAAGEPYVVATDGSPYVSSTEIKGRAQPTVESIKAYEPDVVIAPETTPPGLVASLRAAGIPVFIYTLKDSLKDVTLNTNQVAKLFDTKNAEYSINNSVMKVRKQVETHKNDVKPVIALYNPTHGVYRSGVLRDMIEMIHGVDGAGNLKIKDSGKQDIDAIIHDPDLQNITAVKKGYVYPINDMHIMSYSSWMYYEMEQMSKWLYGDWSYKNYVKYQSVPAN